MILTCPLSNTATTLSTLANKMFGQEKYIGKTALPLTTEIMMLPQYETR